jgi:hypothetical protein
VQRHWLLLAAALVVVLAVRVAWVAARRRAWRRHAARAVWLEITPPVTASPTATLALWRLLAAALPAAGPWRWRPARLVWEVVAGRHELRCGLWIPPGISPTAVLRILGRAWPGVRAEQVPAPALPACAKVGLRLVPTRPDWQPLVDDPAPSRATRYRELPDADEDRLRAVYDALAAAGRTGGALLQVVIGRAPAARVAVLRRATVRPDRAHRPTRWLRLLGLAAGLLRAVVLGVLDLLGPSRASIGRRGAGPVDPYMAELARMARAKYAAAPHLLVAVRTVTAGPTTAAAFAAANDITGGYGLLSPHWTRRRLRRLTTISQRWAPTARMSLASVEEAAGLAGLPTEPAAFGLPAAGSRRRLPVRDTFRTSDTRAGTRRPSVDHADPEGDLFDDGLWSIP